MNGPHGSGEVYSANLTYRPLESSEIRLVRFCQSRIQSDAISLEIEQFQSSSAPRYLALSYVWGDATDTRQIEINSRECQITKNLLNALCQLRKEWSMLEERIGAELFLWVDAVCINQQDLDEKSREVPRMGKIYSEAQRSLIWLGKVEELRIDPDHVRRLFTVIRDFKKFKNQIVHEPGIELAELLLELAYSYREILNNPWFQRIWVIQEYALSRHEPLVLLGNNLLKLRSLCEFDRRFGAVLDGCQLDIPKEELYLFKLSAYTTCLSAFGPEYLGDVCRSQEWLEKPLADQLTQCTQFMGVKDSTLPHDRIYGFLGMLNTSQLPGELIPDYRQPYSLVCRHYTRFLIENTKHLSIIEFDKPFELKEQQSWVADFRFARSSADIPRTCHNGGFSTDGDELIVDGINCGKTEALFFPTSSQTTGGLRGIFNMVILPASKILRQPPAEVWRCFVNGFLLDQDLFSYQMSHLKTSSQSATGFLAATLPGQSDYVDDEFVRRADRFLENAAFGLSDAGTISWVNCRLPPVPAVEVQIWALQGSTKLSVLCLDGPGKHRYLGWVRKSAGYLDDEILDDEFFSKGKIERISLV